MNDRIKMWRERIEFLRNRPDPTAPYDLIEHARLMNCTVEQARAFFTAAHHAEIERTQRLIEMLERDLEELTKPYVAPLPKPTKPRRK